MNDFEITILPESEQPKNVILKNQPPVDSVDLQFNWDELPAEEQIRLMREQDAKQNRPHPTMEDKGVRVTPDQWARWRIRSGENPAQAWADAKALSESGESFYIPKLGVGDTIRGAIMNLPENFLENAFEATAGVAMNVQAVSGAMAQLMKEVVWDNGIRETPLLDALVSHYGDIYGDMDTAAGRTILAHYIKDRPSEFLSDLALFVPLVSAIRAGRVAGLSAKARQSLKFRSYVIESAMDPGNIIPGAIELRGDRAAETRRIESILSDQLPGDERILLPAWTGATDWAQHRAASLAKGSPLGLTRSRAAKMYRDFERVAETMTGAKKPAYDVGESIADAFTDWDNRVKADYDRDINRIFDTKIGRGTLRNHRVTGAWGDTIAKMEELIASYELPIAENSPTVARLRALLGNQASGDNPATGLYKSMEDGISLEEMDRVRSKWLQIVRDQRKETELIASPNDWENAQVTDAVTADFNNAMDDALGQLQGPNADDIRTQWTDTKSAYAWAAELKNRKLIQRVDKMIADGDYARLADEMVNDKFYRRPDIADALKDKIFSTDMYTVQVDRLMIRNADTGVERALGPGENIADAIRNGDELLNAKGDPVDLQTLINDGAIAHGKDDRVLREVRSHYLESLFAKGRRPSEEGADFSWQRFTRNLNDDLSPGRREAIETLFEPETVNALDAMAEALQKNAVMSRAMDGSPTAWNLEALATVHNAPELALIADTLTGNMIPLDNSTQVALGLGWLVGRDAYMGMRKTGHIKLPEWDTLQKIVNAARSAMPYARTTAVAAARAGRNIEREREASAPLYRSIR